MSKPTYLSAQLRESAPYLRDAGWHQTADLLLASADEIERLRRQLEEERALKQPSGGSRDDKDRGGGQLRAGQRETELNDAEFSLGGRRCRSPMCSIDVNDHR